jgi:uncharacterized Zn finger protein
MTIRGTEERQYLGKLYDVQVECPNCGYQGQAKVLRNISVATVECTQCGNFGLQRKPMPYKE